MTQEKFNPVTYKAKALANAIATQYMKVLMKTNSERLEKAHSLGIEWAEVYKERAKDYTTNPEKVEKHNTTLEILLSERLPRWVFEEKSHSIVNDFDMLVLIQQFYYDYINI